MSITLKRTTGINLLLALLITIPGIVSGGDLSGSIIDSDGNLIEESIYIGITQDFENWEHTVTEDGNYTFTELPAGGYIVIAICLTEDTWYYRAFYPGEWDIEMAEWVHVPENGEATDVNITLRYGGRISGSVTPGEGGEFEEDGVKAKLFLVRDDWFEFYWEFLPDNPAEYFTEPIPPGEYIIRFDTPPPDLHVALYYGDAWFEEEAEWFTINAQELTEDISMELPLGGGVTGTVSADGEPFPGSLVLAIVSGDTPWDFYNFFNQAIADHEGVYVFYGIPDGDCFLRFIDFDDEYASQWYDGVYSIVEATSIPINAGEMTENIDADLERGITLSGTIHNPDGNVPEEPIVLEFVDEYGSVEYIELLGWDEDGNWTTDRAIPPGSYALHFENRWPYLWAETYIDGELHSWDAVWTYWGSGAVGGPFDITLQSGGVVDGNVTDPDGNPVQGADVSLQDEFGEVEDSNTDENGYYSIGGVPEGNYRLMAQWNVEGGIDEECLWPIVCNDGADQISEAEDFAIAAGETTNVNLQFVGGAILHADITGPDGEYYDIFENNLGMVGFPIRDDGLMLWDVTTYPEDPPFAGPEGVYLLLPPGNYTLVCIPLYSNMAEDTDAPHLSRTFYGNVDQLEGARFFNVNAGETTEISVAMNEGGQTVSGAGATADDVSMSRYNMLVSMVDADGLIASVYFNFMDFGGDGSFYFNGVNDGDYYLAAINDNTGYAVSTFYPDVAVPGMNMNHINIPEAAEAFEVDGEDIENLEIVIQTVENLTSAPRDDRHDQLASSHRLHGIYPNPFNSVTHIMFSLSSSETVTLKLYDLMGREVTNITSRKYTAGAHHVLLNAGDLAGGVYFVKMKAGNWESSRKVVLIK
ncbi:MAG: carboxypeptidase regulatory-like domain-containing protein [Candidatus Hatepunaea meridiana]|nr:carboxypeptidase regulatory-like domain-containing protein [Candidatus Hatepunaea meridiana]